MTISLKTSGVIFMIISIFSFGCTGTRPEHLGLKDGVLSPCPDSPNCVSTFAEDDQHKADPIPFSGPVSAAKDKLYGILKELPRTKIVEEKVDYIYTEFTSAILRFVDDVEFYFDQKKSVIHYRSASRLGHSDFGANRKRMDAIKTKFMNPD